MNCKSPYIDCDSEEFIKKGFTFGGKQRYKCKKCGHVFVEGEDGRTNRSYIKKPCKQCKKTVPVTYAGQTQSGNQRYKCTQCGATFSYGEPWESK